MGVYIKGMKMPENCEDCNLESYCSLWVDARRMSGPWEKGVEATIRHPDCPLVEVKVHDGWLRDSKYFSQDSTHTHITFVYSNDIITAPTTLEAEVE